MLQESITKSTKSDPEREEQLSTLPFLLHIATLSPNLLKGTITEFIDVCKLVQSMFAHTSLYSILFYSIRSILFYSIYSILFNLFFSILFDLFYSILTSLVS